MKEPSNSTIIDFLGEDNNAYYVLRQKAKTFGGFSGGSGYILESYDKNFKLLKIADIEPGFMVRKQSSITSFGLMMHCTP